MRTFSYLINKHYPLDSEAKILKFINALFTNEIKVTHQQDATICSIIGNPELIVYFHTQLDKAKKALLKRQKAISIIKPGNAKDDKGMSPDDPMNVAIKRHKQLTTNRKKIDEDFEYGLSDV